MSIQKRHMRLRMQAIVPLQQPKGMRTIGLRLFVGWTGLCWALGGLQPSLQIRAAYGSLGKDHPSSYTILCALRYDSPGPAGGSSPWRFSPSRLNRGQSTHIGSPLVCVQVGSFSLEAPFLPPIPLYPSTLLFCLITLPYLTSPHLTSYLCTAFLFSITAGHSIPPSILSTLITIDYH